MQTPGQQQEDINCAFTGVFPVNSPLAHWVSMQQMGDVDLDPVNRYAFRKAKLTFCLEQSGQQQHRSQKPEQDTL